MVRPALFALLVFASCASDPQLAEHSATDSVTPSVVPAGATDLETLTESWTASLNLKDASIVRSFYADTVYYYGGRIGFENVLEQQRAYFNSNPDYHQKITDYTGEEKLPDGSWRVHITKEVTAGGKTATIPSELIYEKRNGIWKIVSESDNITELSKAMKQDSFLSR
jgi:hypothetical protein